MIRSRRLFGLVAMLCLLGFSVQVGLAGLASAGEETGRPTSTLAQSYQQGPLETRESVAFPDLPPGAEELLGLSVLAAVLYGLRASGLARESERSRRLHGR
jgi:hypothetical protein